MIKYYIYAGLDFLFDQKGQYYFLEANSAPSPVGSIKIFEKLAEYMKKQGKELCLMTSLKFELHHGYPKNWVYNTMKKYIPYLKLCYEENNKGRKNTLIDTKGNEFSPDCIFKDEGKPPPYFEDKIPIINSRKSSRLTTNKIKTYEVVLKHIPHLRIPKTFVVRNTKEARGILKNNPPIFRNGFVIKPIDGALGRGVQVFDSPTTNFDVSHPMILEQRIIPRLTHGHYWDLRVLVAEGKVADGVIRHSKKAVTNFAKGGKSRPVSAYRLNKVRSISERIVEVIDKECRKP